MDNLYLFFEVWRLTGFELPDIFRIVEKYIYVWAYHCNVEGKKAAGRLVVSKYMEYKLSFYTVLYCIERAE